MVLCAIDYSIVWFGGYVVCFSGLSVAKGKVLCSMSRVILASQCRVILACIGVHWCALV